jgi:hypothetical protein
MRGLRDGTVIKKTLVYWRDIPAQVIVQKGRRREKAPLSPRFQEAIDRAAMRAGKGSSDAYLAEWRRESSACESINDLREFAEMEAKRIEAEYSDDRLLQLIRRNGSAKE